MSEQFDPQDLRSMIDYMEETGESDSNDVLLAFVENSLFLTAVAHHWHLQCQFYSTHMELDEFYKELPEYVDSFIEGLMAERGPIYPTGNSYVFQPLEDAIMILEEYQVHSQHIREYLDSTEQYGSVNAIEDIISFVDATLYKLKFLR